MLLPLLTKDAMYHLNDADGRAVDCIMHSRSSSSRESGEKVPIPQPSFELSEARLQAASAILDVISLCPAQEPPPNLIKRTMRRVDLAEPSVSSAVTSQSKSVSA